jgi:hypothetical protein
MSPEVSDRAASTVHGELFGSLPRRVARSGGDGFLPVALLLFFFLGGAAFFGWYIFDAVQQTQQRAALRSNGRLMIGEVTRLTYARGGKEYVSYIFTVDGVTYSNEVRVPGNSDVVLHESDRISVRFLPSSPAINHPDAWEWSAFLEVDSGVGGLFIMALATAAFHFLRRDRKLARDGKPAQGVVKSCTPDGRRFRVEYEFDTENGKRLCGASSCKDTHEAGQNIWILYLPKRPRRNRAYPLSDYEIVG